MTVMTKEDREEENLLLHGVKGKGAVMICGFRMVEG